MSEWVSGCEPCVPAYQCVCMCENRTYLHGFWHLWYNLCVLKLAIRCSNHNIQLWTNFPRAKNLIIRNSIYFQKIRSLFSYYFQSLSFTIRMCLVPYQLVHILFKSTFSIKYRLRLSITMCVSLATFNSMQSDKSEGTLCGCVYVCAACIKLLDHNSV